MSLVEKYDAPDIWAQISGEIDDLVQNSKPLDEQVLPDLIELSWPPVLEKLLVEGTRIASGALMRRERCPCTPLGRPAFVKIPPKRGIATRAQQISVFIPIAIRDSGNEQNAQKEVDLSARHVPDGKVAEFVKGQPGSVIVGFENVGIISSAVCYGALVICKKQSS